ncbi:MAG: DUF4184 family protein [Actinobacteria bacterium]|nr:DUF4184 family protein [Actinomycetota bacterium]
MPFTPAHVAAVLPLRRWGRVTLPFAALAAGSVSPDLPYYLPGLGLLNRWTHTAVGIVTVDVLLGLALWAVWRSAATALRDLSPVAVRERWHPPGWGASAWWAVLVAVAIGAATHVVWDDFTHAGRFASTHLGFLAATYPSPLGPLPGYRYAQYLSGAIGLTIVIIAAVRHPRTPATPVPDPRPARVVAALCVAAGLAGAGYRLVAAGAPAIGWDTFAFQSLTGGIGAASVVLLLSCWALALAPRMVGWARASGGAAGQ